MPRWRALPGELDPRVGGFVEQLRRTVDRAGMGVAAVADRTGYGKASWERYLDGRLLAPKGAVVALAEVTGTPSVHLVTLWELAERAWNAAETRHDRTVEAVRISRAPTAPGEFGPPAGPPRPTGPSESAGAPEPSGGGAADARPRGGSQRAALFLAGASGVVIVAVGAFLLTGGGDARQGATGSKSPSATVSSPRTLPPGVLCAGADCTGRDAEETGCGDDLVATAESVTVGPVRLEVRYSRTCGAAWGRITGGVPGDAVRVTAGSVLKTAAITAPGDTDAYTPMVAVTGADDATACAVLASGPTGCTP
ncbi:DUF2690 domain-containing protein [Streptomyces sp. B21-102]|uniref:helix-turn-helix domain-containing protein n=1 Tax=Streptomyces sp. B21-102 TaxID=3039416 RepID=UPI002FF11D23